MLSSHNLFRRKSTVVLQRYHSVYGTAVTVGLGHRFFPRPEVGRWLSNIGGTIGPPTIATAGLLVKTRSENLSLRAIEKRMAQAQQLPSRWALPQIFSTYYYV